MASKLVTPKTDANAKCNNITSLVSILSVATYDFKVKL